MRRADGATVMRAGAEGPPDHLGHLHVLLPNSVHEHSLSTSLRPRGIWIRFRIKQSLEEVPLHDITPAIKLARMPDRGSLLIVESLEICAIVQQELESVHVVGLTRVRQAHIERSHLPSSLQMLLDLQNELAHGRGNAG